MPSSNAHARALHSQHALDEDSSAAFMGLRSSGQACMGVDIARRDSRYCLLRFQGSGGPGEGKDTVTSNGKSMIQVFTAKYTSGDAHGDSFQVEGVGSIH